MPWVIVWPVLVVATLVGGFFLVRDGWRRVRATGRAAARASRAAGRAWDGADELARAAAARHPVPAVALLRERDELRADVAAAQAARDRRHDARDARRHATMARWPHVWR